MMLILRHVAIDITDVIVLVRISSWPLLHELFYALLLKKGPPGLLGYQTP